MKSSPLPNGERDSAMPDRQRGASDLSEAMRFDPLVVVALEVVPAGTLRMSFKSLIVGAAFPLEPHGA